MEKELATEAVTSKGEESLPVDAVDPALNKRVLRKLDMR